MFSLLLKELIFYFIKITDKFKFWPDQTSHCWVICPWLLKKGHRWHCSGHSPFIFIRSTPLKFIPLTAEPCIEPEHDKTCPVQCGPSGDLNQPEQLQRLIRLFAVCSKGSQGHNSFCMWIWKIDEQADQGSQGKRSMSFCWFCCALVWIILEFSKQMGWEKDYQGSVTQGHGILGLDPKVWDKMAILLYVKCSFLVVWSP